VYEQVLCCLAYSIANCEFIGLTVIGLSVEVNSVFLHLRKLMQILHVGFNHPVYRIVCHMNLISFIVCRFAFSLLISSYGLFAYRHRMSTLYFSVVLPTVAILWVVNIVLFGRLFTNDVLRRRQHHQLTDSDHMLNEVKPVAAVVNNNHSALSPNSRNKTD